LALLDAYLRRKKWEFRTQAVMLINAFNESMGAGSADGQYTAGLKEISTDAMFDRIGLN